MASKTLAIILGAGPGTGQALAIAFSKGNAVALLARRKASLESVCQAVEKEGGVAKPFACDASDKQSILDAFAAIKNEFPDHEVKTAVFNANNPFLMKPFLELTPDDLKPGLDLNVYGAFTFSQQVIPLLLEAGGGSLIFSGATAALRGGAKLAAFSPSKFALRSLSQTIAREFGPQGVHSAHVILDGFIDTPALTEHFGPADDGKRIKTASIAAAYVNLANQDRSAWTQELDLRPYSETF